MKPPDGSEVYKRTEQRLTARTPGGAIEFRCEHCRYENAFPPSGRVYICYNCRQVLAVHSKREGE